MIVTLFTYVFLFFPRGNESQVTNRVTSGSIREEEATSDYQLIRQDHRRLRDRLDDIRQLTDRCLYVGQESIPTALLDAMLNVNSPRKPNSLNRDITDGTLEGIKLFFSS